MTRPIVVRADARRLPLPDASVDLIVTSPPYFALRSYTDGGQHYEGQIGSEPTPAEFIAALVECTREWVRVLKPSGSIFVNLGDKYAERGGPERAGGIDGHLVKHRAARPRRLGQPQTGVRAKSLMLLPERYRIACVDELGLIARAVIVWSKPNGLPESVTDRVRRSHEDWVHLVKQPRYFAAVDEIREPQRGGVVTGGTAQRGRGHGGDALTVGRFSKDGGFNDYRQRNGVAYNPLGKLPGSVWEVATEPLQLPAGVDVDHFAAFPSEWPRRLVLGWSPSGICTACGEGRRPVVDVARQVDRYHARQNFGATFGQRTAAQGVGKEAEGPSTLHMEARRTIIGYACACTPYTDHPGTGGSAELRTRPNPTPGTRTRPPQVGDPEYGVTVGPWREHHFDRWTPPPTRPAVVLDPFGGTGTTAHVAAALGRVGITVDLSGDYSRLAAHRELAARRRRKVLGLDPPPKPAAGPGQLDLLAGEGG
jgi:DNA modification methylase